MCRACAECFQPPAECFQYPAPRGTRLNHTGADSASLLVSSALYANCLYICPQLSNPPPSGQLGRRRCETVQLLEAASSAWCDCVWPGHGWHIICTDDSTLLSNHMASMSPSSPVVQATRVAQGLAVDLVLAPEGCVLRPAVLADLSRVGGRWLAGTWEGSGEWRGA